MSPIALMKTSQLIAVVVAAFMFGLYTMPVLNGRWDWVMIAGIAGAAVASMISLFQLIRDFQR